MSTACLNCEHARADHSRVLGCTYNDGDTWVCPCDAHETAAADERIYGMCLCRPLVYLLDLADRDVCRWAQDTDEDDE